MTRALEEAGSSGSPPAIGAHRLLGDGASTALVRPDGEIDWWCAPEMDGTPALWSLLDAGGAAARWQGVRMARADGVPAGSALRTVLHHPRGCLECWDVLAGRNEGQPSLVRLIRNLDGELDVVHELALGGFDAPWASWSPGGAEVAGGFFVRVAGGRELETGGPGRDDGRWRCRRLEAPEGEWAGLVVAWGHLSDADPERLLGILAAARGEDARVVALAKLPRRRSDRAVDALRVLHCCTYAATGAVVASPTTSLPEAPGGDRQFDYRYSWLRDASLAVSVAALIGRRDLARRYLGFVIDRVGEAGVPTAPVSDVRGDPVPPERDVLGVSGWGGSEPVRVGNGAGNQVQYDALGLLVEAVSVHLQLGASLDPACWEVVRAVADAAVEPDERETSGIWELRRPKALVSADIGRWLALDRAVWIARGWRPWTRRGHWKQARDALRGRILDALDDEGGLPQSYDDTESHADASALMVVVFGMLGRRDPRAGRLVDATLARLGSWPFVYRYEPGSDDGFEGREGAFLPVSWWAVAALAELGRLQEAEERLAALDRVTPRLMAEEIDPETLQSLGNVPLVWSHMEAVRALYVVDAAERRRRHGAAGLWAWRIGRHLTQRWHGPERATSGR